MAEAPSQTETREIQSESLPEDLLSDFYTAWGRAVNIGLALRISRWEGHGLTTGQLRLVVCLRDAPGPLTPTQLSRQMHVAAATVTRMSNSLVERKLVRRVRDHNDRRVVRLTLTDSGEAALQEMTVRGRRMLSEMAEQLGEAKMRQLTTLLAELADVSDTVQSATESDANSEKS